MSFFFGDYVQMLLNLQLKCSLGHQPVFGLLSLNEAFVDRQGLTSMPLDGAITLVPIVIFLIDIPIAHNLQS